MRILVIGSPSRIVNLAVVFLVFLCLGTNSASAAPVTFDGIPGLCFNPDNAWTENGVTAVGIGGNIASWDTPDRIHLDDSGSGCGSGAKFTTGGKFDAVSIDIQPVVSSLGELTSFCSDPVNGIDILCGLPYDNVLMRGFADDELVAEAKFFMGPDHWDGRAPDLYTFLFDDDFRNLDTLTIMAVWPDMLSSDFLCASAPCSHFNIDNLVLNPIPLPGASPLLLSAIAVLALIRLRRNSQNHRPARET